MLDLSSHTPSYLYSEHAGWVKAEIITVLNTGICWTPNITHFGFLYSRRQYGYIVSQIKQKKIQSLLFLSNTPLLCSKGG